MTTLFQRKKKNEAVKTGGIQILIIFDSTHLKINTNFSPNTFPAHFFLQKIKKPEIAEFPGSKMVEAAGVEPEDYAI